MLRILILLFLFSTKLWAANAPINVTDGTATYQSCYPYRIQFGTVTSCNGQVAVIPGSGGGGTPGSPVNSVQYNSAGSFAGSSKFTFDGTNVGIGTSVMNDILEVSGTSGGISINGAVAGIGGIDSNTTLMLHLNNNITDSSSNSYTCTNTSITFSNSTPFFSGSFYGVFSGAPAYINCTGAAFNPGAGNFTLEINANITSLAVNNTFFSLGSNGTNLLRFVVTTTGAIEFQDFVGTDQLSLISSAGAVTTGSNQHFVVQRNGNIWNIGVNGVSVATQTISLTIPNYSGNSLYYGYEGPDAAWPLVGNSAELRISNIARYSFPFTPATNPFSNSNAMPTFKLLNGATGGVLTQLQANGSNNSFTITNNGSTAISVDNNNNTGIGTGTPGKKLDVNGSIRAIGQSIFLGTDNATSISSTAATSAGIQINTNSLPRVTVDVNGNVGINSTAPGAILDVGGTLLAAIFRGNVGIDTISPSALLTMKQPVGFAGNLLDIQNSAGTSKLTVNSSLNLNYFSGGTASGFVGTCPNCGTFRINPTSASDDGLTFQPVVGSYTGKFLKINTQNGVANLLTIDAAGNLGLGTSTPGGILDVRGTVNINALDVTTAGNVGIGSVTPGQLLDVQGTVRMSKIGTGLAIATGTNAKMGTGSLSSGTSTISTTAVKSTSLIFLTDTGGGVGANIGALEVGTITGQTSFVVNSSNALDSSNFNWLIIDTT